MNQNPYESPHEVPPPAKYRPSRKTVLTNLLVFFMVYLGVFFTAFALTVIAHLLG